MFNIELMIGTYSEPNLVVLKLRVQLGQEHREPAHIVIWGLDAADDLILLHRAALEQARAERGLLRRRNRVVHRAQARAIVTEIRLADWLS